MRILHCRYSPLTTVNRRRTCAEYVRDGIDWLAAGIRPEDSIIFVQSHVPEVTELHTILSMVTPLGKLTDLPTFKEKARMQPHNINYGLVGYPVLMTADIVLSRHAVPVVDQAPH
jgi:tryptophanyl-tRNA synthetase